MLDDHPSRVVAAFSGARIDYRLDHDDDPAAILRHVTIENEEYPDECVMMPLVATEEELHAQWIIASQGSYVDLDDAR